MELDLVGNCIVDLLGPCPVHVCVPVFVWERYPQGRRMEPDLVGHCFADLLGLCPVRVCVPAFAWERYPGGAYGAGSGWTLHC